MKMADRETVIPTIVRYSEKGMRPARPTTKEEATTTTVQIVMAIVDQVNKVREEDPAL
jgi:hypothetical protein